MKEKILEIIEKHDIKLNPIDVAAEDITAMVFEFVKWVKDGCPSDIFFDHVFISYDLNSLFNYWLTNLYKK